MFLFLIVIRVGALCLGQIHKVFETLRIGIMSQLIFLCRSYLGYDIDNVYRFFSHILAAIYVLKRQLFWVNEILDRGSAKFLQLCGSN